MSRVNKIGILEGLADLQNPDGSFMASIEEQCCDMRFVYCAASVCTFLNSFESIDKVKMIDYILRSQTYEGAFGQGPDLEAHGGSTYCAVAALSMLKKLPNSPEKCLKWCMMRLKKGFHGRPQKDDDTCYTFWVGGALKLLTKEADFEVSRIILNAVDFVLSTQDGIMGGLAKLPENSPDPLHTYLGLAGLSLANFQDLRPVDAELNITQRAREFLDTLHKK